ncbi:YkgJ family cysteine cluster protein [Prolixibacteraceae bacterium Z1-6]|uniref:YkgJ family cysteine cluster protein n=1 Tax=Draconibacterium aestuarii TaxID=2998507 RepID=A0A9X3F9G0_9BACT|nr:YkgJ family cysteine cluster protein [Prolixibacteraceae bacterium Z1-6]
MKCEAGRDLCCMDYSMFSVDFHAILNQLKNMAARPNINKNATDEDCIFLNEHKCTIYEARPVIFRTHGLPLFFVSDEGNCKLSACELNYTEFDRKEFSSENSFSQDKLNSKLFMQNKAFRADLKQKEYEKFDLITIKKNGGTLLTFKILTNEKNDFILICDFLNFRTIRTKRNKYGR